MAKELTDFSLIDKSLTIDGTIHCRGKLIVNGTLKGKVIGENIIISEKGAVYADVTARSISIAGKFEGSIHDTEEVIILSTGICSGSIQCDSLLLDPGGIVRADVDCLKKDNNKQ